MEHVSHTRENPLIFHGYKPDHNGCENYLVFYIPNHDRPVWKEWKRCTLNLCGKFFKLLGRFWKSQWPPMYFVCEPDYNGGENYAIKTGLKNQCI